MFQGSLSVGKADPGVVVQKKKKNNDTSSPLLWFLSSLNANIRYVSLLVFQSTMDFSYFFIDTKQQQTHNPKPTNKQTKNPQHLKLHQQQGSK